MLKKYELTTNDRPATDLPFFTHFGKFQMAISRARQRVIRSTSCMYAHYTLP